MQWIRTKTRKSSQPELKKMEKKGEKGVDRKTDKKNKRADNTTISTNTTQPRHHDGQYHQQHPLFDAWSDFKLDKDRVMVHLMRILATHSQSR